MPLPDIRATSGSKFFVFQQYSVLLHRAKHTLLDEETPDFYRAMLAQSAVMRQ